MASETTFLDIRCGSSVSKSFHNAAINSWGRDSFISWFYEKLENWPHYNNLFSDLGKSELLIQSLSHTSFLHENTPLNFKSYERLEFLGDAVLDLLVSKNLINIYPNMDEGSLSKLRGALVNEANLSRLATALGLGDLVLLGRGEYQSGGAEKPAILSDIIESTLAVFYLDKGITAAEVYFEALIKIYEEKLGVNFFDLSHLDHFDSKTKLQEKTMALFKSHPVYSSTELSSGEFEVRVLVKDTELASMVHISKKKAEKILAEKILNQKLYEEVKNAH